MMGACKPLAALLLVLGPLRAISAVPSREAAGTVMAVVAAPASDGERLFDGNCAPCHAEGKLYPGTMQLRRSGRAPPVLARRADLDADYVRLVARGGIGWMPGFTPVQLSDADLDKVARWLAGPK